MSKRDRHITSDTTSVALNANRASDTATNASFSASRATVQSSGLTKSGDQVTKTSRVADAASSGLTSRGQKSIALPSLTQRATTTSGSFNSRHKSIAESLDPNAGGIKLNAAGAAAKSGVGRSNHGQQQSMAPISSTGGTNLKPPPGAAAAAAKSFCAHSARTNHGQQQSKAQTSSTGGTNLKPRPGTAAAAVNSYASPSARTNRGHRLSMAPPSNTGGKKLMQATGVIEGSAEPSAQNAAGATIDGPKPTKLASMVSPRKIFVQIPKENRPSSQSQSRRKSFYL